MTLNDMRKAIERDHNVVFERFGRGDHTLRDWLATLHSTNLSRQQLTDYYTDWVQEQRRAQPHLSPWGLLQQLCGTGLSIGKNTFYKWWADLPLPPEPIAESSACRGHAPQPMNEATGSEIPGHLLARLHSPSTTTPCGLS